MTPRSWTYLAAVVALFLGCAQAQNPAISSANFDRFEQQLVQDQDVRIKDLEAVLGPARTIDPASSQLPLPPEAQSEPTWQWRLWEDAGNKNKIIGGFGPEGRLMKIQGFFRG